MKNGMINNKSYAMQVYDILKNEICSGIYPPGYQIVETELASRLNISRSPVRDAIHQLSREGLLDYIPNRGVYVKQYTSREVHDIFEIRLLLERYAISHIDPELRDEYMPELMRLIQRLESPDDRSDDALDLHVHEMTVLMTGNKMLYQQFSLLYSMTGAFRSISLNSERMQDLARRSHLALLKAVASGDTKRALQIIQKHMTDSEKQVQLYYKSFETGRAGSGEAGT